MTPTRRLAAIMAADVAGFSAAMERDEEGTFAQVQELRQKVIEPKIEEHVGRLVKTTGDGFLAEFASPIAAMRCALSIQAEMASAPLQLRIGLNLGDVIVEANGDVYGEGVNVAARLEALADPGGILISAKVHSEVEGKVEAAFEDRGEQQVKNIARPVRVYAARIATAKSAGVAHPAIGDGKPLPLPEKPSIAVLPFQNMSGDPEQEYFADGMVEDIITALSRFKSLFVIARNSSFTYKGKAVDLRQVGRELGVRYVLEGSVRKAGNRVRITGQLIEAATGSHLWADRFEGSLEDVFDLQDEVTTNVVGAIIPRIDQASRETLKRKPPENWDAYDHHLRGRMLLDQRTLDATNEALGEFHKAIALDPDLGVAYAYAGYCTFVRRNNYQVPVTDDEIKAALESADRATELAGDDDQALSYAVWALCQLSDEFRRCLTLADRAIALNPNSSLAWMMRGWVGLLTGEPLECAFDAFARTVRLNPFDRLNVRYAWFGNAVACLASRRYQEGADWANKMLDRDPDDSAGLAMLIENAALAGRTAESEVAVARYRAKYPQRTGAHLRRIFLRNMSLPWAKEFAAAIEDLINRLGLSE